MAEVKEPSPATPEPSMEEILASIRKIISDDTPPATEAAVAEPAVDDVVELTQMVQEDGSIVDLKAAEPEPAPVPEPVLPPVKVEAAPPPPPPSVVEKPSLVSDTVASTSASALSSLASTVEIERLASAPAPTYTPLGNGARTLEDMAIELLRPLLKDWLEKNLPATVERLVQKEIERISKRV